MRFLKAIMEKFVSQALWVKITSGVVAALLVGSAITVPIVMNGKQPAHENAVGISSNESEAVQTADLSSDVSSEETSSTDSESSDESSTDTVSQKSSSSVVKPVVSSQPQKTESKPIQTTPPTPTKPVAVNRYGNSSSNIICGRGQATVQGDWIYYADSVHKRIMKMRLDGSDVTKITDIIDEAAYLNVIGDTLYYLDESTVFERTRTIYTVRTDGTQKFESYLRGIGRLQIVGDRMYWTSGSGFDDGKAAFYQTTIYDFGGATIARNTTDDFDSVSVVDDWVYYINNTDRSIYKMKTDGSQRTLLVDTYAKNCIVSDGWVYYVTADYFYMYRVKTDGSEVNKLDFVGQVFSDGYTTKYSVENDWIYYMDHRRLYKVKTDGSGYMVLTDGLSGFGHINVVGDWIFVENIRIRTDGTGRQELS